MTIVEALKDAKLVLVVTYRPNYLIWDSLKLEWVVRQEFEPNEIYRGNDEQDAVEALLNGG